MPEYRITITLSKHGRRDVAEDNMERLLEAFSETHHEVGAVVGANFHLDRLDVTFSLDAPNAQEAYKRGSDVFVDAFAASGLEVTEIIEINCVVAAEATAEDADRELVAA